MTDGLKFGTSGLRGPVDALAGAEARRYAAAFVRHLRDGGWSGESILTGRDLRPSSGPIATDVASALAALGIATIDAGEVPTPALALVAITRRVPAIMITGSHIPADRNGMKFYLPSGEIGKDDEAGISAALADAPSATPSVRDAPDALEAYRARYAEALPPGALSGWRIGVWQHSSVVRDVLAELLEAFGAEIMRLGRSDEFIAVDTEAISQHTAARIADWVKAHQMDALVSADGDGDRPLVADEAGAILRGDSLGMLAARFLGARTVVTPVTSNSAIETMVPVVIRTRVGSPYVIGAMHGAQEPVVGFEANGGLLLGSDVTMGTTQLRALPTRDAILPILAALGASSSEGMKLSRLAATLPHRVARSDRLKSVSSERSAMLIERLQVDAAKFFAPLGTIAGTSSIDGLRFAFAGSGEIVHFRPSGNAPELRCYTEAATAERADELLAWGLAAAAKVVR
jgi:phosphomannomutase